MRCQEPARDAILVLSQVQGGDVHLKMCIRSVSFGGRGLVKRPQSAPCCVVAE